MNSYCKYLFIYGTLLDANNQFGAYLRANSSTITQGYFPGILYDMGEYPGAIYKPDSDSRVYGTIVELSEDSAVLKNIDAYEGYGENEAQPNLFTRHIAPITTGNSVLNCWVYFYNLPVGGFPQIISGNYRA